MSNTPDEMKAYIATLEARNNQLERELADARQDLALYLQKYVAAKCRQWQAEDGVPPAKT